MCVQVVQNVLAKDMRLITMELRCHRQKTVWWIIMVSREGGGSLFIRQHMFYMQNTMGACRCRGRALVMC